MEGTFLRAVLILSVTPLKRKVFIYTSSPSSAAEAPIGNQKTNTGWSPSPLSANLGLEKQARENRESKVQTEWNQHKVTPKQRNGANVLLPMTCF